jgi:hypothetical protein
MIISKFETISNIKIFKFKTMKKLFYTFDAQILRLRLRMILHQKQYRVTKWVNRKKLGGLCGLCGRISKTKPILREEVGVHG